MRVVEPVDQVHVAGSAAARAHCELAGQRRPTGRRECGLLLVPSCVGAFRRLHQSMHRGQAGPETGRVPPTLATTWLEREKPDIKRQVQELKRYCEKDTNY